MTHILRFSRRLVFAAILADCFFSASALATETNASYLTALQSITSNELKHHVEYLADDAREGRESGTRGGRAAAEYLKKHLAELELLAAGADGDYFQPFGANYRNILGLLPGSNEELKEQIILIGAHYDHIGTGTRRNSRGPIGQIHNGADDNASGSSAVMELAEAFAMLPEAPKRSIAFAFWDAEEKGLLGSRHWTTHPTLPLENVVLAVNLDMIGRLEADRLTVLGTRSGTGLRRLVSFANGREALSLDFSWELEPNSDHYPFFQQEIPVLLLHTGMHDDHHSPRDDAELIRYPGTTRVTRLLFEVAHELANRPETPEFRSQAGTETEKTRAWQAAQSSETPSRLGVGWQREDDASEGVRLTRVMAGSPAETAGLRPGDRIVRFADREIRSSDDLSGAVATAESPAALLVERSGDPEPRPMSLQLDGQPMRLGITWQVDAAEPGTIILTRVVPGTPAARAGLEVGDRVYRIAGRDFADDRQFAEWAAALAEPLELLVERDGQLRTAVLYLKAEPPKRAA